MTLKQKIELICQEYDWKDIANDSKKVARRLAEIVEEDRREVKTETVREVVDKMYKIRNSGFQDGDIKVNLADKYDFHLRLADQEPLTAQDRYDFYRGTEYVIDYLIRALESRHTFAAETKKPCPCNCHPSISNPHPKLDDPNRAMACDHCKPTENSPVGAGGTRSLAETLETVEAIQRKMEGKTTDDKDDLGGGAW